MNYKINRNLDLKGEVCPYTFVKSKLVMEEMGVGEILKVIVDFEPASKNIPKSFNIEGQTILRAEKINDTDWEIIIRKDVDHNS